MFGISYEARLEVFGLSTLTQRRERGDLIKIFKIIKGFESVNFVNPLRYKDARTRGHDLVYIRERMVYRIIETTTLVFN